MSDYTAIPPSPRQLAAEELYADLVIAGFEVTEARRDESQRFWRLRVGWGDQLAGSVAVYGPDYFVCQSVQPQEFTKLVDTVRRAVLVLELIRDGAMDAARRVPEREPKRKKKNPEENP